MAGHVQSGPFGVLCGKKSTPAGKKYTSGAGGAGDKSQLWVGWGSRGKSDGGVRNDSWEKPWLDGA